MEKVRAMAHSRDETNRMEAWQAHLEAPDRHLKVCQAHLITDRRGGMSKGRENYNLVTIGSRFRDLESCNKHRS